MSEKSTAEEEDPFIACRIERGCWMKDCECECGEAKLDNDEDEEEVLSRFD